jgi:UDP-glucose:glycoprotein glucosyltransferase
VVDPISEPTQRLVPLLRAARDHLKLPLSVILAPQSVTDDNIPITSYYRFVADPLASPDGNPPRASFSYLPANHILTLRLDVPESWNVQQTSSIQDTDNLRCDVKSGCGDDAQIGTQVDRKDLTRVEYGLKNLLIFGQCYDATTSSPPNGLQLTLSQKPVETTVTEVGQMEVGPDGSVREVKGESGIVTNDAPRYADTLVMKTVGYWQLRANPGVWDLNIAPESRGAEIFDFVTGVVVKNGKLKMEEGISSIRAKSVVVKDFVNSGELLVVKRREGYERATLFYEKEEKNAVEEEEVINVFSLATGHLYERFLKIMMLSVTKRTSSKVKFWLFENFLSPTFKESAMAMAERIGCEVEFVTYKWPEWLRGQNEKQRIIWGYKILFLDVLFPLNVKKIIYVDADQVVRGDLKELWDMDLHGAPYGYTPMCSSRETTLGFQFWRSGFWKSHLGDKPYHISALYVVDLQRFRRNLVGDQLRSVYQQLSSDPNSLANLDQDLPNYAQHQVPIFSLPQEWLWCESWCSDETKATAKTIDLCNNPLHKEPKVSMAKRIISGELFNESWVELDQEVEGYEREFLDSQTG